MYQRHKRSLIHFRHVETRGRWQMVGHTSEQQEEETVVPHPPSPPSMQTVLSSSGSLWSAVTPLQVHIIILKVPRSNRLPRSVALGAVIELYTCVSFLLGSCLVEPILRFCRSSFPLSLSICQRRRESVAAVAAAPLPPGPAMRL